MASATSPLVWILGLTEATGFEVSTLSEPSRLVIDVSHNPLGTEGASGSGCNPGTESLPDGTWFGFVADRSGSVIEFDLACLYSGEFAQAEAAKDEQGLIGDLYIRNEDARLRTLNVDASVPVFQVAFENETSPSVPFDAWPLGVSPFVSCPDALCAVWLFIDGGRVSEIAEQYLVVPGDLGLASPMASPACSGSYVTFVGAVLDAEDNRSAVEDVLSAYPSSLYLRSEGKCNSLRGRTDSGQTIYAIFFGPFATLEEACAARAQGPPDAYVKPLDNVSDPSQRLSCP